MNNQIDHANDLVAKETMRIIGETTAPRSFSAFFVIDDELCELDFVGTPGACIALIEELGIDMLNDHWARGYISPNDSIQVVGSDGELKQFVIDKLTPKYPAKKTVSKPKARSRQRSTTRRRRRR